MGMVVQHNMNALNAYNKLNTNVSGLKKSSEKLSSGYRINRAGDDAAGLAISEKMRSQIRGLTQAKRNSQDGISMLQTFEGATQESHSILQRMKELATESANGTYQDEVDRDAIQLEFNQLNDELDQIADTDFNGVVMLNGGEMADGLKAVDGKFDYTQKSAQVKAEQDQALADAQATAKDTISKLEDKFKAAKAAYDAVQNRDLCLSGEGVKWNTIDDNKYTAGAANKLFSAATSNASGVAKSLAADGVKSFNVQYKFDGTTNSWTIDSGSNFDVEGTSITTGAWYIDDDGVAQEVDLNNSIADADITTTDNGGFIIGKNGMYGNAVFATREAKDGDVITLTYTNAEGASYAPTNIGMDEASYKDGVGLGSVPKLELTDRAKDNGAMNEEMMAALEKLDKSTVSFQYTKDGITATIDNSDLTITADKVDTNKFTISYTDSTGKTIDIATVETVNNHEASTAKLKTTSTGSAGAITENKVVADGDVVAAKKTYTFDGTNWKADDGTADLNVGNEITWGNGKFTMAAPTGAAYGDKLTIEMGALSGANAGDQVTVNATYEKATGITSLGTTPTDATETESKTLTYSEELGFWTYDGQNEWTTADSIGGQTANFTPATFIDGNPVDGDKITLSTTKGSKDLTFSYSKNDATVGSVSFGIALDEGKFDAQGEKATIDASKSPNGKDSSAIDKAYEDAKAALNKAKAEYPNSYEDLGIDNTGVSVSDSNNAATAPLTYSDHLVLQTGSRTKDSVDFTFNYSTNGLGDLKANLNLSSREDGLNTKNLSLATQEDANVAIDKIDNAINKTSMVRATFGATQNRLEHKIENLTTNTENLTEAESTIRDTDMASEMLNYTKYNVLQQAAQSMLAQANQQPQSILQLLG